MYDEGMLTHEGDEITLRNGRRGYIAEVLEDGVAVLVDFPKPMGDGSGLITYDTEYVVLNGSDDVWELGEVT